MLNVQIYKAEIFFVLENISKASKEIKRALSILPYFSSKLESCKRVIR
jgi:hypothetical protein